MAVFDAIGAIFGRAFSRTSVRFTVALVEVLVQGRWQRK
jgi:hypothetical protein